jgi:hypothetical protein
MAGCEPIVHGSGIRAAGCDPGSCSRPGRARSGRRTSWDAGEGELPLMATPTGLEPATSAVTGRRANQLRYGALRWNVCSSRRAGEADSGAKCSGPRTMLRTASHRMARCARMRYPQRDSNPRYRRERAASWATRRWGRVGLRHDTQTIRASGTQARSAPGPAYAAGPTRGVEWVSVPLGAPARRGLSRGGRPGRRSARGRAARGCRRWRRALSRFAGC